MDIREFLPLAPRDLLILSVLAHGPSHGYGIIKAVEDRSESGVLLDPANLYRALRRMRELGWIVEEDGEDPRRRVYGVSRLGQGILAAEVKRLDGLLAHARPALARSAGE